MDAAASCQYRSCGLSSPVRTSMFAMFCASETSRSVKRRISADRKSTRLNSSHGYISYAVFCLKKTDDPAGAFRNTTSYNIALHPAFWFGVAMCDTFSYPQTVSTRKPDRDRTAVAARTRTQQPG